MPNPYRPPLPAREAKTPEQRKEWLDWYAATREQRNKDSEDFNRTAGFSLLLGFFVLCVVPLGIILFNEVMNRL